MASAGESQKPRAFVKWSEFQKVLEEVLTGGITTSLYLCTFRFQDKQLKQIQHIALNQSGVMKRDGSLLCLAGDTTIEKVVGAQVSGIWGSYEQSEPCSIIIGSENSAPAHLQMVMMECQKGKLAVTRVSNFLIVLCANEVVEYGMLRRKLLALQEYLQVPLMQVYPSVI